MQFCLVDKHISIGKYQYRFVILPVGPFENTNQFSTDLFFW